MKVKGLDDHVEIHRRRDSAVPIKSCLKNEAGKFEALIQAVKRYEQLVHDSSLLDEGDKIGSERFEAGIESEEDGVC